MPSRNKIKKLSIFPRDVELENLNWFQILHAIVSEYFRLVEKPRYEKIYYLRHHNPNDYVTLDVIANELEVTRERARQMAELSYGQLCYLLRGNTLKKPYIASNPTALEKVRAGLQKHISGTIILVSSLENEAKKFLTEEQYHYVYYTKLLFTVLGYAKNKYREIEYYDCSEKSDPFLDLCNKISSTVFETIETISAEQLAEDLNTPLSRVLTAIELMPELELISKGVYRVSDVALRSKIDLVYRILKKEGTPIDINDLTVRTGVKYSVSTRLSRDSRFKCIGKTGMWGLSEWHFNGDTIIELIKNTLKFINKPATFKEILACINITRPELTYTTIKTIINLYKKHFKWVALNTIVLAEWDNYEGILRPRIRNKSRISNTEFYKILADNVGQSFEPSGTIVTRIMPLLSEYEEEYVALKLYSAHILQREKINNKTHFKLVADYTKYLEPKIFKKDLAVDLATSAIIDSNGKILLSTVLKMLKKHGIAQGTSYPVLIRSGKFKLTDDPENIHRKYISLLE
jgi:hypothetical protein